MPPIEAMVNLLPPLIVSCDESQQMFVSGELKWDLLTECQRPRNGALAFVLDVLCPAIN